MVKLPIKHLYIMEVWLAAFKLWKISFKSVLPFIVIFAILASMPYFFVNAKTINSIGAPSGSSIVELILVSVFYTFVMLLLTAAIYYCIFHKFLGRAWSYRRILVQSSKKTLLLFVGFILYAAVLICGYALFLIPGIFYTVVLTLYYPSILLDNLSPIGAFKQSSQLAEDHWWETAIVVTVPFILFCLTEFLIQYPTLGIGPLGEPIRQTGFAELLDFLGNLVLGIFYLPFYIGVVLIQFQNLKQQKIEEQAKEQIAAQSTLAPAPVSPNGQDIING